MEFHEKIGALLLNEKAPSPIMHRKTGEVMIEEGYIITQEMIEALENEKAEDLLMADKEIYIELKEDPARIRNRVSDSRRRNTKSRSSSCAKGTPISIQA